MEQLNGKDTLPIFTSHTRNGQIFRGHPNFRGKGPWRDWVWVNWGQGYGKLPAHIWCFVDVKGVKHGRNAPIFGGIALKDGTYAVVETTILVQDELDIGKSDLMAPISKEVTIDSDGVVTKRTFFWRTQRHSWIHAVLCRTLEAHLTDILCYSQEMHGQHCSQNGFRTSMHWIRWMH